MAKVDWESEGGRDLIKMAYAAGLDAEFLAKTAASPYGDAKMDAAYKAGKADRNRELWSELLFFGCPFIIRRRGIPD